MAGHSTATHRSPRRYAGSPYPVLAEAVNALCSALHKGHNQQLLPTERGLSAANASGPSVPTWTVGVLIPAVEGRLGPATDMMAATERTRAAIALG
jgi:hypothetical protein